MAELSLPTYQQRLVFIGSTRTGKTELAKRMLREYPRWVIIDLKGGFTMPGVEGVKKLTKPPIDYVSSGDWRQYDKIIYSPKAEYQVEPYLSLILEYLFRRAQTEGRKRPFIVYIDEGLFLSQMGAKRWLKVMAITGAEIGLGLWVASQRPVGISVEVRSEAWKWYVFYMGYEEDDKEVMKYSKGKLTKEMLNQGFAPYSFYEMTLERGGRITIKRYPPITLDRK